MRLIDADALREHFKEHEKAARSYRAFESADSWDGAVYDVEDAPTIDAEPVVRCNICKYYETDVGFCNYHGHGMHWDGYCSCGAKMDLEVQ